MARPKGALKIKGSIGNLSFYTDKRTGDVVRSKGGPSKQQIKKLKSCEPVRNNNSEFGVASSSGKLLRRSLYPIITVAGDNGLTQRVVSKLLSIVKMDEQHAPGKRVLLDKHFHALGRIELNEESSSWRFFQSAEKDNSAKPFSTTILVDTNLVKGATHFRVMSVVSIVDFKKMKEVHEVRETGYLEISSDEVSMAFDHTLEGNGIRFHGFCILFYQQVNGEFSRMGGASGFIERF